MCDFVAPLGYFRCENFLVGRKTYLRISGCPITSFRFSLLRC